MVNPETSNNHDAEEWSKGRATALFVSAVLSGFTLVLATSYWLTRESQFGISLQPIYIWEIILFMFAISAMTIFACLRNNRNCVVDNSKSFPDAYMDSVFDTHSECLLQTNGTPLPFWTRIPLRVIALCICCVGSVVFPFLEAYRSIDNMRCFENSLTGFRVLKFGSKMCRALFCIVQLFFLLRFKKMLSKHRLLRLLMSVIVAANFTLCMDVMLSTILASDTVDSQTYKNKKINISSIDLETKSIYIECKNNSARIDRSAEWVYKFSHQFPYEFAVLSLCYFGSVWNVFRPWRQAAQSTLSSGRKRLMSVISTEIDSTTSDKSTTTLNPTAKNKHRFLIICAKFLSTWSFPISSLLILGIFAFHMYMELSYIRSLKETEILVYKSSSNATDITKVYAVVQTTYIYIVCIVAPIGFMLARKEDVIHKRLNPSDVLLFAGATGHLIFILFGTVDVTEVIFNGRSDFIVVMFFIKMILKYQSVFAELMIVLIASKMEIVKDSIKSGRQLLLNGIIIFLGVFNTERWFTDNFLPPNVLRYVEDIGYNEMYGRKNWWLLTQLLYPSVMIFRLAMSIMCFETCVRLKREPLKAF